MAIHEEAISPGAVVVPQLGAWVAVIAACVGQGVHPGRRTEVTLPALPQPFRPPQAQYDFPLCQPVEFQVHIVIRTRPLVRLLVPLATMTWLCPANDFFQKAPTPGRVGVDAGTGLLFRFRLGGWY